MTTAPAPTLTPVTAGRRPTRSRSLRPWYRNGSLIAGSVIARALILVALLAPPRSAALRPWYRNGSLIAGIVIVGALILVAIFAPLITPYSPTTQNLTDVLQGPSGAHWLGTHQIRRDVFTRLIW